MLIKIDGELRSMAPEGGEAGGAGMGDTGAGDAGGEQDAEGQQAAAESDDDSLDGEDDPNFSGEFNLDDFLAYDPFAKKEQQAKQEEEPAPARPEEEPVAKKPEGDEPAAAPAAGSNAPAGAMTPEMQLLLDQNRQLMQQLQQIQQGGQQQQATAEDDETEAYQKADQEIRQTLPQYQFQIPDSVMQKMGSEDPAKIREGLAEFAQGIAQVTHYNVMMQSRHYNHQMEKRLLEKSVSEVKTRAQAEESVASEKKKINNDFYGKFPALNKPEYKFLVQSTAASLAQEMGVTQWNQAFRDALGNRVLALLGQAGVNQGPQPNDPNGQQPPQQQQKRKPGQRFNAGSGAGRANNGKPDGVVDDIADTLFG